MLKAALAALALVLGAFFITAARPAAADSGAGTRVRLESRMRSGITESKLSYEYRNNVRKFQAEVSRAQPGQKFDVRHNGVLLGSLTANELGVASVEVKAGGDDPNQGDVPFMLAGDAVSIGGMTGTLVRR